MKTLGQTPWVTKKKKKVYIQGCTTQKEESIRNIFKTEITANIKFKQKKKTEILLIIVRTAYFDYNNTNMNYIYFC